MKPRGRPRIAADDTTVNVHLRMSSKQFDATQQKAREAKLSVPDWLRWTVKRALARTPPT
jgi:hypothetical protein